MCGGVPHLQPQHLPAGPAERAEQHGGGEEQQPRAERCVDEVERELAPPDFEPCRVLGRQPPEHLKSARPGVIEAICCAGSVLHRSSR